MRLKHICPSLLKLLSTAVEYRWLSASLGEIVGQAATLVCAARLSNDLFILLSCFEQSWQWLDQSEVRRLLVYAHRAKVGTLYSAAALWRTHSLVQDKHVCTNCKAGVESAAYVHGPQTVTACHLHWRLMQVLVTKERCCAVSCALPVLSEQSWDACCLSHVFVHCKAVQCKAAVVLLGSDSPLEICQDNT